MIQVSVTEVDLRTLKAVDRASNLITWSVSDTLVDGPISALVDRAMVVSVNAQNLQATTSFCYEIKY